MRSHSLTWPIILVTLFAGSTPYGRAWAAQSVPQPFPRPSGDRVDQTPPPPSPTPRSNATRPTSPAAPPGALAPEEAPSEELLGVAVYPGARFLRSYDAGAGQRYYLFGSAVPFAELVGYYRSVLRDRGELVYDAPPVHMFEVGRFREESMAFPPGVTVKDYTWGGTGGWLDPRPDASPQRYPTIIQIVPVPPIDRRQ
jgi:hypothetical protein